MNSVRKSSARRINLLRSLRDQWLVVLGTLYVPFEALRKGVDTYYDFMNVKWAMGWMILQGNFDLKGLATSRKWNPPFLDLWHAVIASSGIWWFPVVVHGLAHSLIVPSTFFLAKRAAPTLPNIVHQVVAVLSVAAPLVAMQIGTTSGHIYASLPLIWAVTVIFEATRTSPSSMSEVGSGSDSVGWVLEEARHRLFFIAGIVLACSPILKPSVLVNVPIHLLGVLVITSSISGTVAVASGFICAYGVVSLGWAAFVAVAAEGSLFNTYIPRVPVGGPWLLLLLLLLLVLGAVLWRHPGTFVSAFARFNSSRAAMILCLAVGLYVNIRVADYLRENPGDYRWFVRDLGAFVDRLFHTGDLRFGFLTLDLEVPYFDTSMLLSTVLLGGVVFLLPVVISQERASPLSRAGGLVIFSSGTLIFNAWATGYARYGSQAIPLVGVAAVAFVAAMRSQLMRLFGLFIVGMILLLPHILVDRVSSGIPRFAQLMYNEPLYDTYVSDEEADLLSSLLPQDSYIMSVGTVNSFLAPRLGRTDLTWWFWRPKPDEVRTLRDVPVSFVFSPGDSDRLPKYAAHGLIYQDCTVLRFTNTSVGVCRGEVIPTE